MSPSKSKITAFLAGFCLSLSTINATAVEIAESPLFIANTADPNIMFILDDSGSMRFGFVPEALVDDIGMEFSGDWVETDDSAECPGRGEYAGVDTCYFSADGRRAMVSHHTNALYYDPSTTYVPPMKADGNRYPNASYTGAWLDGYDSGNESATTINLSNNYRAIMDPYWRGVKFCSDVGIYGVCKNTRTEHVGFVIGSESNDGSGNSGDSAFYFNFVGGDGCDAAPYPDSCFSDAINPSTDAEKQNFANWFSYYRNRQLLARAGITSAFIDQSENMRIGYGSLNTADTLIRGVKPFSRDDRSAFFNWLQGAVASGATPLRSALQDAGEYYKRGSDAANNPWRTEPANTENTEYVECRQSFTILMTDGYWSDPDGDLSAVGDEDSTDGGAMTGPSGRSYTYTADFPFKASSEDTLADVAMEYWKNDLQAGIQNRVPTTDTNPAFWQHMITYGVGLGVSGTVSATTAFDAIESGDEITWPDPTAEGAAESAKIDDLLHAAVNSRGGFFSAADPSTFGSELRTTLGQITEVVGSASGVTFDTATLEEDSLMFSAKFDSSDWDGDLDARQLSYSAGDDEPSIGEPVWSAATKLNLIEPTNRVIVTYNGSTGAAFRWANLTDSQKADLAFGAETEANVPVLGQQRLSFLRGDRSKEGNPFRERASRLGDIVHSTPVRVAKPASVWPDTEHFGDTADRYSDFRADNANRTPVIYVGANDGMLHGFKANATGGEELIAYVPGSVYSSDPSDGLHHLTSPSYSHQYYVDLSPLVTDVYTKGRTATGTLSDEADWRTVLFGGLRSGGRGIFALDVTNPTNFTEANAAQLALWEFTPDASDSRKHLGYNIQPPQVALADWGTSSTDYRWTAFVASGYNSGTDSTGFFMIDIEAGIGADWVEDTNFRYVEFSATSGGLSPLTLYDGNGDKIVDRVYAGDTAGNMWVAKKYTSGNDKTWLSSYGATPLFTAPSVSPAEGVPATPQAITSAPMVIPNAGQKEVASEPDTYVIFGTGKYLGFEDISDTRQQAVYAVRDVGTGGRTIDNLAERTLTEYENYQQSGITVLLSEADSAVDAISDDLGWYVDMFEAGERVYLTPQVRGKYIFVTSIIPSTNPCVAGGESRLMAFGLDGLTPNRAVFTTLPFPAVAFKKIDGIANPGAFLGDFMFTPTSGGGQPDIEGVDVGNVFDNLGRQAWQELIED